MCTEHGAIDAELIRGRGEAIPHPAAVFRRKDLLAAGGYRTRYENGEDLDLYLRLAERGRVANLGEVLIDYRQHPGKTSAREAGALRRSVNRMLREAWERRGYAAGGEDPLPPVAEVSPPHEMWRAWARQAIESGHLGTARRYALKLAALRPLSWRSWQLVVRALLGLHAETARRMLGRGAPISMRGVSRLSAVPSRGPVARADTQLEPVVVVCAADDRYAMPLAVTLRSAAARLAPTHRLDVRVIDGGIRPANRQRIVDSLDPKHASVAWIPPRRELLGNARVSGHVTLATYYRLLLGELLPTEVRRVIYLDCDLVVTGDLSELWKLDTGENALLAVPDASVPTVSCPRGLSIWRELGLDPELLYFNAGVLLVDLARWRSEGVGAELLHFLDEHAASVRWWDQDALNGVLAGRWGALDPRWNQLPFGRELDPDDSPHEAAVRDALLAEPGIVHFATSSKPWHWGCAHPDRQRFFDVLDETPWAGWRPRRALRDTAPVREGSRLLRAAARAARRLR